MLLSPGPPSSLPRPAPDAPQKVLAVEECKPAVRVEPLQVVAPAGRGAIGVSQTGWPAHGQAGGNSSSAVQRRAARWRPRRLPAAQHQLPVVGSPDGLAAGQAPAVGVELHGRRAALEKQRVGPPCAACVHTPVFQPPQALGWGGTEQCLFVASQCRLLVESASSCSPSHCPVTPPTPTPRSSITCPVHANQHVGVARQVHHLQQGLLQGCRQRQESLPVLVILVLEAQVVPCMLALQIYRARGAEAPSQHATVSAQRAAARPVHLQRGHAQCDIVACQHIAGNVMLVQDPAPVGGGGAGQEGDHRPRSA